MARGRRELGAGELDVLKVLWDEGPLTVREVLFRLHQRGRKVAYTTAMTFLARLEKKGYVTSDKSDVAYVYRAKVSRERVTAAKLRDMISQLYDGAAAPLVLQLMQTERFSQDEIADFQRLIEKLDIEDSASPEAVRKNDEKRHSGRDRNGR
jgi:predicted transcriptional regulator